MSILLESKFFQPRPRQESVVRPRLLEQLNLGLQRKLILVLAQAGFGKTTLVAHWLNTLAQADPILPTGTPPSGTSSSGAPPSGAPPSDALPASVKTAWLSLDENDNDPLRFFDYLITGLQRAEPAVGHQARSLLAAPQPPAGVEPLVVSLINDLTRLSNHLILILDDYHTITSQEVHQAIHTFISHAPGCFHLMIVSRVEPPLPLTRWRIQREVVEIRENDLRFTLDEAATYLLETMRCSISRAEVAALEQRTEGWIVGLHLAALSLQSHPDATTFVSDFTGSHAYLVDYLTEEVLQRQPSHIQEFLFQTALLTRFCGPLCDAAIGRTGSQKILEYLERSHLFVIPLDNERGWYRYHHLFAEMLRRRAQEHGLQQGGQCRAEIYRRAAQWHIEKELVMEAIEYALAAEESDFTAQLIESNLLPLLARGQFITLLQWLNRLPAIVLRANPRLCATRARIALRQHELDEAEKWLEATWSALAAQPDQNTDKDTSQNAEVMGEASAIRIDLALNRGQIAETIQLANRALEELPESLIHARGEILFFLGIAYYWNDQVAEAVNVTSQAAHLLTRAGDILTALFSWVNLCRFSQTQGKMREAMAALEEAWSFAVQHNVQHLPLMGSFHNNRGELLYEWNQLDAAEENFLRAIDLSEQARNPRTRLRSYSLLLPIYQARGQHDKAEESVQRALAHTRQYQLPANILDECRRTIIRKWLEDGNMAAVAAWIVNRGLSTEPVDAPVIRGLEAEYFLVARYLSAQNNLPAAQTLLEKTAASAHAAGKMTAYIAIQTYHVLLLQQLGDARAAHKLMAHVLEMAEPQAFVRTFVDEGKAMQSLLAALQPRLAPRLQSYVKTLLQAFGPLSPESVAPEKTAPVQPPRATPPIAATGEIAYVERLSERELEVLRLVDEGLSDSQIAAKLVLATGTVKRHLNNIYGKLGVHTRTHALARARTLKLL